MFKTVRNAFLLVIAFLTLSPVAIAQNSRSAVSVNGSDAATCTVPDPCRTFGIALSKTNPDGEVVALTSGGYGPFIVDRPATIVAAPGVYAALVGNEAIRVNAGAGAKVIIRGLHLYGAAPAVRGIVTESSEEVHIEHCVINGFSRGIVASLNIRVSDTTFRFCTVCIEVENATAAVKATINRVELRDYGTAIMSRTNANVTVRDTVAADGTSVGFDAFGGTLNIENCLAVNNVIGVRADVGGTVRVSNTMATDNTQNGFIASPGTTFISWGNNRVRGNATDTAGTITVVTQD